MSKNILLTFLSTVNLKRPPAVYGDLLCSSDSEGLTYTTTTNESAVYYLLDYLKTKNARLDRLFGFASAGVCQSLADTDGSHIDYFKGRLKKYIPDIDERFQAVPYDEGLAANDTLQLVLEMAKQLTAYCEANLAEEVILHVDLTGGMRHANMLILGIMRLLEYNGVKIGKVLYSNFKLGKVSKVEEADEIYKLFDLISGAEEFVRFGSVESVLNYYKKREQTEELQRLLTAMKNFSEQVKLCHYGDFTSAISELKEAEEAFKLSADNKNTALFKQLIGTIEKEYSILFKVDFDDLDLISWCIDKDNIQQALTLFTERVPEYICDNIIELSDTLQNTLNEMAEKDSLHREAGYLLMEYKDIEQYITDEADRLRFKQYSEEIKELQNEIYAEITALLKESLTRTISAEECEQKIAGILNSRVYKAALTGQQNIYEFINTWQSLPTDFSVLKNYPTDKAVLNHLIEKYLQKEEQSNKNPQNRFNALKFGGQRYNKCLLPYVTDQFDSASLGYICDLSLEKQQPYYEKISMMLKYKVIQTKLSLAELNQLYDDFDWVKKERIHSNHAKKQKSSMSNELLKAKLREFVARLKKAKEMCQSGGLSD